MANVDPPMPGEEHSPTSAKRDDSQSQERPSILPGTNRIDAPQQDRVEDELHEEPIPLHRDQWGHHDQHE